MKKIFAVPLLLVGVFVLSGCGSNSANQGNTYGTSSGASYNSMPVATPTPAQGSAVEANAITIQNFAFSPATLTVKKGTTVTWTNNDSAPHQIKSATFNSSQLSKGQSFSFTFNTAGSFDYSCAIHPSMLGKIIVQ